MNKMRITKQVVRSVNHQFVNIEAAMRSHEVVSFSFGSNWKRYLKGLTEERLDTAMQSIREFSGLENLSGQTFLDFGCGSGLFSLAAYRLGADKIVSVDIDPDAIDCVRSLWIKRGSPQNWRILQGSALDGSFIAGLGHASFVYSWGVLHHTGAMYEAIRNVASIVGPQGYFYLAIYNRNKHAAKWLKVKRIYNRLPLLLKHVVVGLYAVVNIGMNLRAGNNPFKVIREYKSNRGMSWLSDIRDWLGGLPYEFATPEEVKSFLNELGFETNLVHPNRSHGCNEFLFIRRNCKQ